MAKFQFWLPTLDKITRIQRRAINSNEAVFVTGVPGTGKTVVSIYRLINTDDAILFTFGKLLRKTIEEKIADSSKTIVNIHKWNYDLTGIYLQENLKDENIENTIDTFKSKGIIYKEIFVDEGQDLLPNSYKLFKALSDKLTVSADEAQTVTDKDESSNEANILEILGDIQQYELDEIFRSSYELYNFARQFVSYNSRANDPNLLEKLQRDNSGARKPFIYILNELSLSYEKIRDIIDDNISDNIGILCEDIITVDDCTKNLENDYEVSTYHSRLSKEAQEKVLRNDLSNIVITTIKSAKGIEFDVVIMPNFQHAKSEKSEQYFVGATRAKSELHLICIQDTPSILNSFDENSYKIVKKRR